MPSILAFGSSIVGDGQPTYVIAEIGINHNGELDLAKRLIDTAVLAGCDCVKFQKRTPAVCVPEQQRAVPRDTPWGTMTYLEYRERIEFGDAEYADISRYCAERGIAWTASVWDEPAADFIEAYDPPFHKIPSAALTDLGLLRRVALSGRPVVLSTGMSTPQQIAAAVDTLSGVPVALLHCTSTYPSSPAEVNLRYMDVLRAEYGCPVGYSGHEVGLQISIAAVARGADLLERHITLDRAMQGSDHAASLEPGGLMRLVRDTRIVEQALGDGVKRVYESELPIMKKLRRI